MTGAAPRSQCHLLRMAWVLRRVWVAVVLAGGNAACDEPTFDSPPHERVAEGSGARIVSHEDFPSEVPVWRVAEDPMVRIGTLDGVPGQLLSNVVSVAERGDGSIVVGEGNMEEVRVFDEEGIHLWTVGGKGDGPGEFRNLDEVFVLSGDSIIATEFLEPDVTVFGPDGTLAREADMEHDTRGLGMPTLQGVLENGTLVVRASMADRRDTDGYRRDSVAILYMNPEGTIDRRIARVPGRESVLVIGAGTGMSSPLPFGRSGLLAIARSRVATTSQDEFVINVYDGRGDLMTVMGVDQKPTSVDPAWWEEYIEGRMSEDWSPPVQGKALEMFRDQQERSRAIFRGLPTPDVVPMIAEMMFDAEGRLWVWEYVASFEDREAICWIFDSNGNIIATATIPEEFAVFDIRRDHVLGVVTDDFGVPYVEVRRIVREDL